VSRRASARDLLERAFGELARYAEGVHQLGGPAPVVNSDLPAELRAFYQRADGADLFFGSLVIVPAVAARASGGRAHIGELDGDDLEIDLATGAVWRREKDSGELIEEATAFDRLLLGAIEADGLLHDHDGEFVGGFDEDGELEDATVVAREKKRVKRDPDAPGPRWRLARALARGGALEHARDELEAVVAARPGFGWAWYDLARLAEKLGDAAAAQADAIAAAEADPSYEHAGFFWAHAARLAQAAGDAAATARAVERALATDPAMARAQKDGAEAQLEAGDLDAAAELAAVAAVLAPRDLEIKDLVRRIAAARATPSR
jgi:tetratricopeptide (TPR) repeat protein